MQGMNTRTGKHFTGCVNSIANVTKIFSSVGEKMIGSKTLI